MVLLALSAAFGWLDLDRIWVNPTYLGSGVLGGILLGLGFIIGGAALLAGVYISMSGLCSMEMMSQCLSNGDI